MMVLGWMLAFDIDTSRLGCGAYYYWTGCCSTKEVGNHSSFYWKNYTQHLEHGFGEHEKKQKEKEGKNRKDGDHIMCDVRCLTSTFRS